jgi:DNA primase
MEHRLIIPFFYHDKIIGYTARSTNNQSPKYLSSQQPGTVFNIHSQPYNRKFIIITEGPIDAISIQATSIMGSTISHDQLYYLQSLNKPLVILPDRDPTGKNIVQQAIDLGLQVSFPPWPHNVKDANDAIRALGRTTALFLISQPIKTTPLKIQLSANSWFRI